MNFQISNFVEPSRVRMIWQSSAPETRTRYHVGDLVRAGESVALFYNWYSPDFVNAWQAGFIGHPAFSPSVASHHTNVLEIMSKRLPPRNRSDFSRFLWKHGLSNNIEISDLALLGYTGAKLPGDGFSFEVDFSIEAAPFQMFFDVAGFRYYNGMQLPMDEVVGQQTMFVAEPLNPHDQNAIGIYLGSTLIGYVPRTIAPSLRTWLLYQNVAGFVDRMEGPPARPMVYIYLSVAKMAAQNVAERKALF